MKSSRRASKKRVRRGHLPQPKGGRLWSRGEEEEGCPRVGARCRVVRPYLASDKERYVGKVGTITEVLGRGYGGHWHVRVVFDDEAIPENLRVTAFPMYCLEILEGEDASWDDIKMALEDELFWDFEEIGRKRCPRCGSSNLLPPEGPIMEFLDVPAVIPQWKCLDCGNQFYLK